RAFRTFTSTSCHGTRATGSSRRGSSGSGGNTRRIRTWQRPRRRSAPPTRRRDKAPAEAGASRVAGGVDPSALPVHLNVPAGEQTFGQRAGRRDDLEVVVAAGLALVDQEHFAAVPAQDGASLELRAVEATRVEALCIGILLEIGEEAVDDSVRVLHVQGVAGRGVTVDNVTPVRQIPARGREMLLVGAGRVVKTAARHEGVLSEALRLVR